MNAPLSPASPPQARIGVLFVESGETGGGSAESMYQHLRVIDRDRYRPVVVYLNEHRFVDRARQLGVPVHVLRDPLHSRQVNRQFRRAMLRARAALLRLGVTGGYVRFARIAHRQTVRALVRIVHDERIDILHLNVQPARDLFGLFAAEQSGVVCISHLRSADPRMPASLFDRRLASYANRMASAFVANSGTTERFWLAKGIDPSKTWRVHNGVPVQPVIPLRLSELHPALAGPGCRIGYVASLRDELKVDAFLLKAFKRFLERRPDSTLVVVGDGPMKPWLERTAAALDIGPRVVCCGFHPEPYRILAAVDASLVINNHDSFGRIALETLVARTPLVATDAGAIRELVEDGSNGVLVPYGDEAALAGALERVTSDSSLRDRLIANGHRTVRERFSIERYAAEIDRIYQAQLTRRRVA